MNSIRYNDIQTAMINSNRVNGTKYKYYATIEHLDFVDALVYCSTYYSFLATIENEESWMRVSTCFKSMQPTCWWIGLKKHMEKWRWLDGSDYNLTEQILMDEDDLNCGCVMTGDHPPYITATHCGETHFSFICQSHYGDQRNDNVTTVTTMAGNSNQELAIFILLIFVALLALVAVIVFVCKTWPAHKQRRRGRLRRFPSQESPSSHHYDDASSSVLPIPTVSARIQDYRYENVTIVTDVTALRQNGVNTRGMGTSNFVSS